MSKSNFIQGLEKLEERYGLQVCVHDYIDCGKRSLTLYRVIETEEERKKPVPIEMQKELNVLLIKEYCSRRAGLLENIRIKIGFRARQFLFSVALEGLTVEEINERQASWNRYANDFNEACD